MERRIDAAVAASQLGQIMDQAVKSNDRFIVDRGEEPPVVILNVGELLRIATPVPEWLQAAWNGARERSLDSMTLDEIDAEIAAYRRELAVAATEK
jgi:hypothetical protein